MTYKHILVTVDLSEESRILIDKASALAKALNTKLSFIHIDVNYAELYTGLIDVNLNETRHFSMENSRKHLQELSEYADYPVSHTLVGSGDLGHEICETINEFEIDLVVCGHHQDFWSKLLSSTKMLINCSPVDMLVIPLKD
ncbi:Universal stress protein A [Vibrio aerogenes CECT 7868]|uniref:Universal stress protein n=1 Tax=Vibrio aerogenes CECT 7868 TaxID=1216006 RepID=A0A1M5ZIR9_9VIBR|nr:universal stress protein [Vibrio aerogenes]SHI24130.1 Universal stress protein A [Vibrio aerogenes CECT 7868]